MALSERTKKALELLKAVEAVDVSASRTAPRVHYAAGAWWAKTTMGDREKSESLVEVLIAFSGRVRF